MMVAPANARSCEGWRGSPEVFTDLASYRQLRQLSMGKEHVLAKGHIPSLTPEAADPAKAFRGWGKVPGLIELTVIGDVCLGDDCLNLPIVQGCCAIIQPSVPGKGQPHKYQHAGAGRGLCQLGQTGQRALPQGLLPKKGRDRYTL